MASDKINPNHYKGKQHGIECITLTAKMNFTLGNAVKYLWRYKDKNGLEDLKKALWYLDYSYQQEPNIANHDPKFELNTVLHIIENYPLIIQLVLFTLLTTPFKSGDYSFKRIMVKRCFDLLLTFILQEEPDYVFIGFNGSSNTGK